MRYRHSWSLRRMAGQPVPNDARLRRLTGSVRVPASSTNAGEIEEAACPELNVRAAVVARRREQVRVGGEVLDRLEMEMIL